MSKPSRQRLSFSMRGLLAHVRTPLYRNGYALILSSASTSILGVLYWILAAHSYTTSVVGLNSAAISAMMFLAGVSQLNLSSALIRFIPGAGRSTWRFVIYAYITSLGIAAVTSVIFILGLRAWAPTLNFVDTIPFFLPWFTTATMAWCIFVLQDSVLTGTRQAIWVPVENTFFGLAKIVLLVVFARLLPGYGIFASWTLALVVTLLPTNILIFRRLIPVHVRAVPVQSSPVVTKQVARYVAADYVGSLFWLVSTMLLPVLVTQQAGTTANAYFYLAWTIAYSLYLVSPNMGSSLIVEAATDQTKLSSYSYRVFVSTARLLVPIVAIVVLGAPYILRIFGNNYAQEGTTLLRLLALSAIPNMVNALCISIARVQRHLASLIVILGTLCALVLALSFVLLPTYGIAGVGMAWLASQTVVAVVLYLTQLRALWFGQLTAEATPKELAGKFVGLDSFYPSAMHKAVADLRFFPLWSWLWDRRYNYDHLARDSEVIRLILPSVPPEVDMPPPITWTEHRAIRTVSDMRVILLGPPGQSPTAALKLPRTEHAKISLQHEISVLAVLGSDPRLTGWRTLLPKIVATGEVEGQPYVVERMLPGTEARRAISNPLVCRRMQEAAASAIAELHQRTGRLTQVGGGMLNRWIDEPLRLVAQANLPLLATHDNLKSINRLRIELRQALAGRTFSLSWIHGDFVPGNILMTPDGARLLGIVDWELARPDDLPLVDLIQLLIATRVLTDHCEMGDVMRALLNGARWTPREQALLDAAQSALPGDRIEMRTLLLLSWLRHVGANLTKSTRYAGNWLWIVRNINPVLRSV